MIPLHLVPNGNACKCVESTVCPQRVPADPFLAPRGEWEDQSKQKFHALLHKPSEGNKQVERRTAQPSHATELLRTSFRWPSFQHRAEQALSSTRLERNTKPIHNVSWHRGRQAGIRQKHTQAVKEQKNISCRVMNSSLSIGCLV